MLKMEKGKIVKLHEEISEEDLRVVPFDLFIYYYEYGCYDGSGIAVWRKGKKWSYSGLGHCSCYGPTENLCQDSKAQFSLEEIKTILPNWDYSGGKEVLEYLNKKRYK